MAKKTAPLLPYTEDLLHDFGERLRLARLRRRLTARQVAERAGMTVMTLRSLERGGAGVTLGAYMSIMQVLGLERDLNLMAAADPLGRDVQDSLLTAPRRAARPKKAGAKSGIPISDTAPPALTSAKDPDWMKNSGLITAETLDAMPPPVEKPSGEGA